MSDIDYSPPIREIPPQHRSVGLRLYADGFKRAIGHFLSGRQLQDAIEEVDRVTRHAAAHSDLSAPIDAGGRGQIPAGSLLDRVAREQPSEEKPAVGA